MNGFWLWFWRPIAEFLGAVTCILLLIAVGVALVHLDNWLMARKRRRGGKAGS